MNKLKIRQYWTEFGRPWYVIRYGHKPQDYMTATSYDIAKNITTALIKSDRFLADV